MFNSKSSVDRHVQELFRKVTEEKERNLRCYNIAKLYYQVGDYESARRYVFSYLEVKSESSGAHKLLGQIYEALGQKEAALAEFKQSLELEARQDDLVLKVCELLSEMEIGLDVNRIKYWVDRASEKFSHNPVVFQLKEKMLMADRPNGADGDLEALIASELSARPSDVNLRVKLLNHYLSKNHLDEAYKHALEVESTYVHRDSLVWYETLCTVFTKFKEQRQPKSSFWIPYISSLERYAALALREHGTPVKTTQESAAAVFNLDQALTLAKLQNFQTSASFIDQMFTHMFGQLNYHMACLLIRRTKREQGSWNETGRLCSPLLLSAIHSPPLDHTGPSIVSMKDPSKSLAHIWHREGAYRVSQASHVLQDYSREDAKRLLDKVDKFCIGSWRERIYQRIFTSNPHIAMMSTSYFANNNSSPPPLRLLVSSDVKKWDEVSEEVYPSSLHHHVWLGLANKPHSRRNMEMTALYPNQTCHIFPDLQFSAYNLNQAVPDSLGRLDIDAFLNATILCSSVIVQEQQKSGFLNRDRMPTLPADTTNLLCSGNQEKWWTSVWRMYKKPDSISGDLMELRQEIQRGLEVIRCIGNHGLHVNIIIHLARMFQYRAKELHTKDKFHPDIPMLEARSELYWETSVPLVERLINNQTIRSTSTKIFDYQGKDMNNLELSNALEEGRLVVAKRLLREKRQEQAMDVLQALKCPEASYLQAEIYKTLANDLIGSLPKESLTSAIRSQHVVLLAKARDCYYLTLDRLRTPGVNPHHPLNSELGTKISSIENDLKRIDPDLHRNDLNRHDCDVLSEDSYSSAQSGADQPIMNSLNHGGTINTPQRHSQRTPKQSSTPRHQHHDILEHSRSRIQWEARPSPERLDAQIRQLVYAKDHVSQTILEQNKSILESIKSLVDSNKQLKEMIEQLKREFSDFRKESHSNPKKTTRSTIPEDDYYAVEGDYSDMNYTQPVGNIPPAAPVPLTPHQIPGNLFANHRHYSPLVYPTPGLPGYYQGGLPFNDQSHHLPNMYPSVYPMGSYPRPPVDQNLGIQPGMFQQGLFQNRLMDIVSPQTVQGPPLTMQLQNLDLSRVDPAPQQFPVIKDAPVNKVPPTNVVITTSDTLPTSAPPVQPILSVNIPPQHRNVGISSVSTLATSSGNQSTPHNYQISMPSHANIPTTVNLPPLAASVTNTIAAVSIQEKSKNTSILSTGSHNSSIEAVEVEHDPIPDFQPVIPLPAEVKVTTGEENEDTLFVARAKLFRFVEKEWKERGVGNVKLLKNKEGKVRLLMRRDQVLKICANHMLTPEMELSQMPNNDRAWIWVANDFADEEVRLEKLCIKFKTAEEAQDFKKSFDNAKTTMTVAVKPAPLVVGGFSFTKTPVIQQTSVEEPKTPKQSEQPAKPSPFAGFSFSKSQSPTTPSGFSFGKTDTKPSPLASSSLLSGQTSDSKPVEITEVSGQITGDNVVILFDKSAVILRCSKDGQCKERAVGLLNLVLEPNTGNLKITMTTPDKKMVFPPSISLEPTQFGGNPNIVNWTSQESSITGKQECYSLSLPEVADASQFRDILSGLQKIITDDRIPQQNISRIDKTVKVSLQKIQPSLAEMFKPAAGSWECSSCYTRNAPTASSCISCAAPSGKSEKPAPLSSVPLSELFKPAPDSWECMSCYTRNTKSDQYCVACEAPSDPSLPPKTKTGGFGLAPTALTPAFTFGIPPTKDKKETVAAPSFQFGAFTFESPKVEDKTSSETKIFPSFQSKPQDFIFSTQSVETPSKSSFTFGSPGKSFDFQFPGKSPVKSPGGDVSEDEVPESEDVYFAPVIPLPEKIEVKTGEEDEEILYTHRAKLFRFDGNTKEWKERGLGDIKLLKHKETNKLRLVMRREQTLKLCLNHLVSSDVELTPKGDNTWIWNAADYSDNEIEYVQLACRFKTSDIAQQFKTAVEEAVAGESTKDECPKMSKSSSVGSAQDIQVVYELKVTDEEKDAALKLQLPENFYAYKQKEDCPGCLGCKEPDVPLFDAQNKADSKDDEASETTPTSPMSIKLAAPKLTPLQRSADETTSPTSSTTSKDSKMSPFSSTGIVPVSFSNKPPFVFGQKPKLEDLENVGICTPDNILTSVYFGKSSSTNTGPIFGDQPPIFGSTVQSKTMFGGSGKIDSPGFSSGFASTFGKPQIPEPVFGTVSQDTPMSFSNPSESKSIFAGTNSSASLKTINDTSKVFGSDSPFGSKLSFDSLINSNASTPFTNPFGTSKPPENPSQTILDKDSKKNEVNFLKSDNTVTFSALAATTTQNAFKMDPLFSFAGAGQSVFGSKTPNSSMAVSSANSSISGVDQKKKVEEDEEENPSNDGQEYDPHYEPIIPLPDAIEVKTGEEEEEKIFGQRAKLYRYESELKEWKERGTGEMKVLHHAGQGTYRLLLRREQVHKVVCNFLITPDLELQPLCTSDRAWVWAGMNFVEETLAVEKLAVKFKNPEIADQFKVVVEKAQEELRARGISQPQIDEHEEQGEEGEDDEDIHSLMYENEASLMFMDEGNAEWRSVGTGQVNMVYDSEVYGVRIIFETMPGHTVCSSLISMETEMELVGDTCTWTALDDAFDPPARRSYRLKFITEDEAQDFAMNFSEGQECARKAGISEAAYYEENEENDENDENDEEE
ncbi:E3 SUMO-protein ligase RanBP2-like [Diachasmimorpha longicaudata]|uniref:E3 SUMO-protein ligase RanBP2-like n=1 Tax=Diachasmimorpha longicaudata TaxID=58733 RepID=UPI0030B87ECB